MSTPDETARILESFGHCLRIWGPPAPRPPKTEGEQRAEDYAAHQADLRELDRFFDGKALDARDDRIKRGYLGEVA